MRQQSGFSPRTLCLQCGGSDVAPDCRESLAARRGGPARYRGPCCEPRRSGCAAHRRRDAEALPLVPKSELQAGGVGHRATEPPVTSGPEARCRSSQRLRGPASIRLLSHKPGGTLCPAGDFSPSPDIVIADSLGAKGDSAARTCAGGGNATCQSGC